MKKKEIKKCKHELEVRTVTDAGKGFIHQYHVNGNICIKCGKLMGAGSN